MPDPFSALSTYYDVRNRAWLTTLAKLRRMIDGYPPGTTRHQWDDISPCPVFDTRFEPDWRTDWVGWKIRKEALKRLRSKSRKR